MQPDKIQFIASPRPPYQALDLGVLMFRRWWQPLLASSFLVSLPFFIPLWLISYSQQSWWPLVLLWWLKPLFERVLLHFYSHALFAEYLTVRQTVSALKSLLKPQLLATLTYRRLSPTRSMDQAVMQLEHLAGAKRHKRLQLLHGRGFGSAATWLTLFAVHLEFFIQVSLFALILFFIPQGIYFEWANLFESPAMNMACLYLSYSLLAPIYVGCGFSLYLNRRTALEGWDIELTFRQLQQRLQQSSASTQDNRGSQIIMTLVLSCGLLMGSLLPSDSWAQTSEPQSQRPLVIETPDQAQQEIGQILEGEAFHQWQTHKWPKWPFEDEEAEPEKSTWQLPEWLKHLPLGLEILLWAGVALLLGLIVYHFKEALLTLGPGVRPAPGNTNRLPERLFSLDVRRDTLPEDVTAEAKSLWQSDNPRGAIALLYRASLSHLLQTRDFPIQTGHTEGDCLRLVRAFAPEALSLYFAELTQAWLQVAYGHQHLSEVQFTYLCDSWQAQFEPQEASDEHSS